METDRGFLNELKMESQQAFLLLYKSYFPVVRRYITANAGTETDAEDIFQETMIVLVHKIRDENFRLSASLKTYIMAISKNLWLKHLRDSGSNEGRKTESLILYYKAIGSATEPELYHKGQLQKYLYKISEHCQGFIDDVFFKEKTMEEIRNDYGYTSTHNAVNQKYKCLKQLKKVSHKK